LEVVETESRVEALLSLLYAVAAVAGNSASRGCDCLAHRFGNARDHGERVRHYKSDMTDAEWAAVRDLLPPPAWMGGRGGRPESYCHRQMLDAVRYVVDNGVKWAALPADFPPFKRVHAFFTRWRDTGLLTEFHDRMRGAVRESEGRDTEPSAAILDSQSVKAAANVGSSTRGYDGGKKVNGRKRHLVVDTIGLVLMVLVTPADAGDRVTAAAMLPALTARFRRLRRLWADSGYTGDLAAWAKRRLGLVVEIVKRTDDLSGFRVVPRRWVVERTFGWLMRSRRLARDYETRTDSAQAMVLWSMTMVMSRRLARRRAGSVTSRARARAAAA
jgi:transposase